MSSVATTNATITAQGVVQYEYDGVMRAQAGSEIPSEVITGFLSNAQIESLEAAKLTGTISETQIANGSITTPKLAAGAVVTATLAAGAVTAEKVAVIELSAISANLGKVTAGVLEGATFRTGTAGARVEISASGLHAYNGAGEQVLEFLTATGNLAIKGEIKAGSTVPATTVTGQLTNAQLKEIEAAKLTGTISETQIGNEAISTPKLKAGAVIAAKIAAGAVTAEKLAVVELSAITGNLGKVTAGELQLTNEEVTLTLSKEGFILPLEAASPGPAGPKKLAGVRWKGKTEGQIELYAEAPASPALVARVSEGIEKSSSATLWEKGGKSSFLQLTATAKRKINFGTTIVKWAGGKNESEIKEVPHGLGSAAVVALGGAQTANTFFVVGEPTGTEKIKLQGYVPGGQPPAGTERTVYWIAIG